MGLRFALALFALLSGCARAPAEAAAPPAAAPVPLTSAAERALAGLAAGAPLAPFESPASLVPTLRALRGMGMSARADALEAALERATRLATAAAAPSVLATVEAYAAAAGEGAGAEPFRAAHESAVRGAFAAAAPAALASAGVDTALAQVAAGADRLPLRRRVDVDPVSLVTDRAVASFFLLLSEEERPSREERDASAGG